MAKLDDDLNKARGKYLRCIRLRQDCANTNGTRWKDMNEKLLIAEENFHILSGKVKQRDAKKVVKKTSKVKVTKKNTGSIWDM